MFISHGCELAFLIQLGGYWLERLHEKNGEVLFSKWSTRIRRECNGRKYQISKKQINWLWNTLASEPKIQDNFKDTLISYTKELKRDKLQVPVLPEQSKIAIFLKSHLKQSSTAKQSNLPNPDGIVVLNQVFNMKPGKEGFLDCCNVKAELIFQVSQLGTTETEANLLEIEPNKLRIEDKNIIIEIDSLNYAFNRIDFRLYKDKDKTKKSYGGSIYVGNLAWIDDKELEYISLDKIRRDVEQGEWEFPNETT